MGKWVLVLLGDAAMVLPWGREEVLGGVGRPSQLPAGAAVAQLVPHASAKPHPNNVRASRYPVPRPALHHSSRTPPPHTCPGCIPCRTRPALPYR